MFAVYAESFSSDDPLSGLVVGERPDPVAPDGWTTVTVKAASLNHHDLWSLRGVGLKEDALPMILGCDAAGLDEDGNEVVVHAVDQRPGWTGDETLDPKRSLLSERHQGTFAEQVAVPRAQRGAEARLAVASRRPPACRPPGSRRTGCCSPRAGSRPATRVLVQGAGGGVATALIMLARAAGLRVLGDQPRRGQARPGARDRRARGRSSPAPGCRCKVDAVMETVGQATWSHSIRSLRPGGTLVISGTTSGPKLDDAELTRIFFLQLRVIGSTMGTRDELASLVTAARRHRAPGR